MALYINPVPQYLDSAGKPYIDGLLYMYKSGTTTFQTTYADVGFKIPNPNPIPLTADGRVPNIRLKAETFNAVLTGTDSITGLLTQVWQRDPIGGESSEGQFSVWNSLSTYSTGEIVEFDGAYYRSIAESNQGNSPDSSPTFWSEIKFTTVWNVNETYPLDAIVQGSDGVIFISQIADNVGNDPTTDTNSWSSGIASSLLGYINSAVTLNNGDFTTVDSSGGTFTITLPASPDNTFRVDLVDYLGTWQGTNITLARNGSNIMGLAEDLNLNVNNGPGSLAWVDSTRGWILI